MTNAEIAGAFERVADLMEIDGADRFRVNSYRKAARTVKDYPEDLADVAAEGRLLKLDGIGKSMAEKIEQYLATSDMKILRELEAKLPAGLPALLDIQGMGPKKVALIHKELGVGDLDDLKAAIESGELAELSGMGKTSVENIRHGIEFLEQSGQRTALGIALPLAELMAERVRSLPGVSRVEIAGSARRGEETVGDLDILCTAEDPADTVEAFTGSEDVKRKLAAGDTKGSITVDIGRGKQLQIDLRAVPAESFGAAWQYFTGSKEHNVQLRERAVKKKWRLNEYGLYDSDEKLLAGKTEEDIYEKLGLPWIPPEQRQGRGELTSNCDFTKLVSHDDIVSDLHMHTTASDGKNSIEEMAEAAKALGYTHIAICDHSRSSTIANGLSIERMEKHIEAIRQAEGKVKGIRILVGTECDILPDGSLDYPDEILSACEWVVASVHSAMGKGGKGKLSPTERSIAAMENPYVCVIAHPSGRLINKREPMELEIDKLTKAAERTHTALEINANWRRMDLKDLHVRQALDAGAMISINTDAHHTDGFHNLRYGLLTARRGGCTPQEVVNCWSVEDLLAWVGEKRV